MPPDCPIERRPIELPGFRDRQSWALWAVILLPFVAFAVVPALATTRSWAGLAGRAIWLAVLAGGLYGPVWVHMRTTVLRMWPDRVERTGPLVRNVSIPIDGVQGMLTNVTVWLQPGSGQRMLVLAPASGRRRSRVLRLYDTLWPPGTLETVAAHAGVPVVPGTLSGRAIERRVPRSVPLYWRRPLLWCAGMVLGLFAGLAVALAVAYTIARNLPFDSISSSLVGRVVGDVLHLPCQT